MRESQDSQDVVSLDHPAPTGRSDDLASAGDGARQGGPEPRRAGPRVGSLERAAGAKERRSTAEWKAWWKKEGSGEPPPPEAPPERPRTVVRGTKLEYHTRGKGRPLLVLPDYELGLSVSIAVEYAAKYPKSVSRLVLCSGYANESAWTRGRQLLEETGRKTSDLELVHYAQHLEFVGGAKRRYTFAAGEETLARYREMFQSYFANPQDLEIARLLGPVAPKAGSPTPVPRVSRPMGDYHVGGFDLFREAIVTTPTLLVTGERACIGGPRDQEEMLRRFESAKVEITRGARMPFIEDPARFLAAVEKHLR